MQMNRMQHILLSLLRAGLWGKAPSIEEFPLTAEEWKQLFFESVKQTVQGVVFDGIQLLPAECCPPEEIRAQWQFRTDGRASCQACTRGRFRLYRKAYLR